MRKAELKFDAEGDFDPIAVFFEFGKSGVEANITRWKGQFQGGPAEEEREKLGDGNVLVVLSGTYLESSGGPFSGNKTPRPNYKMLAAILEGEATSVFVKLTAPGRVADEVRESFTALIKSALD